MFFSPLQKSSGQIGFKTERGAEINSYIKDSLTLELSWILSINDYCWNTGLNSLHADSFKFRSKPQRPSPLWSQWSYGSVPTLVLHISENAVFSTASWVQLFCTFTFFFLSAYPLLWWDAYLCFSPLQASRLSYRGCAWQLRMTVSAIYLLYIILLYQTDLSDARGGSLTETFGVARFIVIEHPCLSSQLGHILVSYCPIRWFLLKQATISYLYISRCWVCNDGGFGLFRFLKGTFFPYSLHHWHQTKDVQKASASKRLSCFKRCKSIASFRGGRISHQTYPYWKVMVPHICSSLTELQAQKGLLGPREHLQYTHYQSEW